MLKNIVQLKDIIEGKEFHLLCDNDSPLPSLKEFLFRCLKYVGQIEDQVKAQQAQSEQSSQVKEEIKTEQE